MRVSAEWKAIPLWKRVLAAASTAVAVVLGILPLVTDLPDELGLVGVLQWAVVWYGILRGHRIKAAES